MISKSSDSFYFRRYDKHLPFVFYKKVAKLQNLQSYNKNLWFFPAVCIYINDQYQELPFFKSKFDICNLISQKMSVSLCLSVTEPSQLTCFIKSKYPDSVSGSREQINQETEVAVT